MTLFMSRLRIARNPSLDALSALLRPEDIGERQDANHRLLWSAFAGDTLAKRDFLWRDEGGGVFLALSSRSPGPNPLFEPHDIKEYAPNLSPGDRLAFTLRANATKDRARAKVHRRVDVVMNALLGVPDGERAMLRMEVAQQAGAAWLGEQGARNGFVVEQVTVADYTVAALPGRAGRRKGQPQFGILDMTGMLKVIDPAAFLDRVSKGFGRARAFGCGLMLIRRA